MSFLRDYLLYASDNEAPEMFHVWAAYTALSSAISRKVWLPQGRKPLYTNIYVMLVGDAGNGKSLVMHYCKELMSLTGDIPISRSVETPQGLLRYMGGNAKSDPPIESPVRFTCGWPDGVLRDCHPMTILANEFVDFISMDEMGWIHMLNNIFDEGNVYSYRTKGQGEDYLEGPYIVLLGGLTTDIAHEMQKARIISTGLARRTIFQYGERRWDNPHAILRETPEQAEAFRRCLTHMKLLRTPAVSGPFRWTDDTIKWWTAQYDDNSRKHRTRSPTLKSWFASKPDQVLKLAMLTSLSEDTNLEIKIPHIETALAFLDRMEEDLGRIFGGAGRNELAAVAIKIEDYIKALQEPISRKRLKALFFQACKPPNDFDDCLRFLIDGDRVTEKTVQVGEFFDTIIATRETMDAFFAKLPPLRGAVQSGLHQAAPPATDPPNPPTSPHHSGPAQGPTAAQSPDGKPTAPSPPHLPD